MKAFKYIFIPVLLLVFSCNTTKIPLDKEPSVNLLPGGVMVGDSIYIDISEISHICWEEYLSYLERYYGKGSERLISALPDTNAAKIDSNFNHYYTYGRHRSYYSYPMTFISQQQAIAYSKWRSDRVMEFYLTQHNLLEIDTICISETEFTIERYYNKELNRKVSDNMLLYYPEFRLPSYDELVFISTYIDSLDNTVKRKNKRPKSYRNNKIWKRTEMIKHNGDSWFNIWLKSGGRYRCEYSEYETLEPLISALSKCLPKTKSGVYLLNSNANEWTNQENLAIGKIWYDTIETGNIIDTTSFYKKANPYTGFRNIGEWKKYEPDSID